MTRGEYEAAAYIGFRRALNVTAYSYVDDEGKPRSHFGAHIDGAVAELFAARTLGLIWLASLEPNRKSCDCITPAGTPVEVRHTRRDDGGLPLHRDDRDDAYAILVRGVWPQLELAGGIWVKAGRVDEHWRADLPRPCWIVPASKLTSLAERVAA